MVWLIIAIIGVFLFSKYASDKANLRNSVILKGGLDKVFNCYIKCIEQDFAEYKIVRMTETEIEIFTQTKDGKHFVFANKLGFGSKVNYRCDPKRSSFLNAEIAVEGSISNQVQSYQMILNDIIKKYGIEIQ